MAAPKHEHWPPLESSSSRNSHAPLPFVKGALLHTTTPLPLLHRTVMLPLLSVQPLGQADGSNVVLRTHRPPPPPPPPEPPLEPPLPLSTISRSDASSCTFVKCPMSCSVNAEAATEDGSDGCGSRSSADVRLRMVMSDAEARLRPCRLLMAAATTASGVPGAMAQLVSHERSVARLEADDECSPAVGMVLIWERGRQGKARECRAQHHQHGKPRGETHTQRTYTACRPWCLSLLSMW